MKISCLIIIFVFAICSISAFEYSYPISVTKIHDGDTFVCDINMGLGIVFKDKKVRVLNCDAYELKVPKLGDEATSLTKNFISGAKNNLTIRTNGEHDGFGRLLADVIRTDTKESLADELTSHSLTTGKWRKK